MNVAVDVAMVGYGVNVNHRQKKIRWKIGQFLVFKSQDRQELELEDYVISL